MTTSKHYNYDRKIREEIIRRIGEGKPIVRVPWTHEGRLQFHVVTDNAIVLVYNPNGMLITKLIARPNQIRRYFPKGYDKKIAEIIEIAYKHQLAGYNEM